jgi:hypothetical protein
MFNFIKSLLASPSRYHSGLFRQLGDQGSRVRQTIEYLRRVKVLVKLCKVMLMWMIKLLDFFGNVTFG